MTRLKRILSSPLFRFSLGLAISGLTMYLALHEVSLHELGEAFSRSDLCFVGLAFISVAVNVTLKVLRWRVLLDSSGIKAQFSRISMSFLSAQMLNTFMPIRTGEISRIYVLGNAGIGHAFVLGTIAVEMALNMIAYALLFTFLLLLIPLPNWIGVSSLPIIFSAFLIFSMVLYAAFYRNRLRKTVDCLIAILPEKFRPFLLRQLLSGLSSLDVLKNPYETVKLAVITTLIWGTAVLTNQLVFLSLGIHLPLTASILILIVLQAGVSLPSLPGKLGVFEYLCILTLGVLGLGQALALSYGILLHVIVYLPIVLSGMLSFWILGIGSSQGKFSGIHK